MWITVDVERALYVDRGRNVILCELMPGHQTLVLKLKGSEMTDEVQRLRNALENIADWRNANISGEHELGLRDIIRSIIDSAVAALESPPLLPRDARAKSVSPCLNCGDPSDELFCGTCREMGCAITNEPQTLLWCCHARGPDDVYAAPDYITALAWSDALNEVNWSKSSKLNIPDPASWDECMVRATPAPWPHSRETHAEDLPKSMAGFADPSSQVSRPNTKENS